MCGHVGFRSLIICFKVQLVCVWGLSFKAAHPKKEWTNSPWIIFPIGWRSCVPQRVLQETSGYIFTTSLLRKKRFKFTWNDIIVVWWAMSIYSRTKCSIRRDGGECMRRSHSKQFRKSVNNVCCLYELWTMKGFSCLPLTMWLHETPRERERERIESVTLMVCWKRQSRMYVGELSSRVLRDNFRQCWLRHLCASPSHCCGFAQCYASGFSQTENRL